MSKLNNTIVKKKESSSAVKDIKSFFIKKNNSEEEVVDEQLIEKIRSNYKGPIIAVIGASSPGYPYFPQIGITVGHNLTAYAIKHNGGLCTGGVSGVGCDIFTGSAMYSAINKTKSPFFTLIPNNYIQLNYNNNDMSGEYVEPEKIITPYKLTEDYIIISDITNVPIKIHRTGFDMSLRRKYLAKICDIVIVMNGSNGTLDETLMSCMYNKHVISLPFTGGCAGSLHRWITGNINKHDIKSSQFMLASPPTNQHKEYLHFIYDISKLEKEIDKYTQK